MTVSANNLALFDFCEDCLPVFAAMRSNRKQLLCAWHVIEVESYGVGVVSAINTAARELDLPKKLPSFAHHLAIRYRRLPQQLFRFVRHEHESLREESPIASCTTLGTISVSGIPLIYEQFSSRCVRSVLG